MQVKARKTAIDVVGNVPWGTHFCQFYETKEDLIDLLVPYFMAGLKNNEFCMWITSEPLNVEEAHRALKKKVRNLDGYIKKGQIEILDYTQWYTKAGRFDANEVLDGWIEKEKQALEKGFEGLRLSGNTFWLDQRDWKKFTDYEAAVNSVIGQHQMLAVCTYSLEKCTPLEIIDVVSNHEFALIRSAGKWKIIRSAEYKKTVEALRESKDKYRVIFEQAADSIVLIDAETGDLVEFNDRTHNNLGYTRQEFQKLKISDFEVIESAHEVAKHIKKIVREGADTFETKQRTKSGEIRDILVSSKSISIGGRDFILSIWRDITERKKALEDLQISEANYRTIFDSANDGIFVHDTESGKILSVNQKACEIFGYPQEEFEKLTVEDLSTGVPPYDQEHAVRWIKKAIKKGPQLFEWACKDNTGRSFWAEINLKLAVIQGQDRMLAIVRDTTARKEAEEALQHSEERYALGQRAANIGSWDWDITTGKLVWSDQIEPMFGFGRGEFAATYEAFLELIHPEDRQHVVDSVDACVEKGNDYAIEHRIVWPDGSIRWISETGDVIRDEGGKAIRMLGIVQDITDRKLAEQQIENLAKFPSENPNPVLRVAKNGTLLYANDVSRLLLDEWNREAGQVVPDNWRQTITEVFASGGYRRVEVEYAGRVFAFVVAPVPEADYVNLYGRDITERKDIAARQELAGRILERLNQKSEQPDLIHDVLKLVKKSIGFSAVAIRLYRGNDFPYYAIEGFPAEFVEVENYLCARNEAGEPILDSEGKPLLECMCGNVLSGRTDSALPFFTQGGSFWTNSTTELLNYTPAGDLQVPTRNRCNQAGYESVALIPLRSGDKIVGLLQLNDTLPGRFTPEMISFFEGICASIGIAMSRIEAEQEIQNLAKFPSENPSPVVRIAEDGRILYANLAGSKLLETWDCKVGTEAPEHWHQYILRILKLGLSEDLEVPCGDRVFSLIMTPVMDAGYVNAYGIDITERKRAEEDLSKYRQHLEELVATRTAELTETNEQLLQEIRTRKRLEKEILNISEREQRRIGQELHDSLGQQLTGIAFMTKVLERKLATNSPSDVAGVAKIAKLVNQATGQARSLAKGLHPVDLDAGAFMSALQELATATESLFGIHCTFESGKRVEVDDPEVAVHLYRITQEAITNAIKHGMAKNIQIKLARGRDKCVLTVKNDGLDFPKEFEARETGLGLQIMDHRVDIIGGSLVIHKAPEGGTLITCTFPTSNKKH
ncbi:MAG: PAS domain S-box protein [Planctomycetota bacterium]